MPNNNTPETSTYNNQDRYILETIKFQEPHPSSRFFLNIEKRGNTTDGKPILYIDTVNTIFNARVQSKHNSTITAEFLLKCNKNIDQINMISLTDFQTEQVFKR